jgi:hypothetical protein
MLTKSHEKPPAGPLPDTPIRDIVRSLDENKDEWGKKEKGFGRLHSDIAEKEKWEPPAASRRNTPHHRSFVRCQDGFVSTKSLAHFSSVPLAGLNDRKPGYSGRMGSCGMAEAYCLRAS